MSKGTLWIGWRLLVGKGGGGRQAVLIGLSVSIASALLFAVASIPGAVVDRQNRDDQRSWLISGALTGTDERGLIAIGHDRIGDDQWTHLLITRGESAAPSILGVSLGSGEVLVSPALNEAIATNPSLSRRLSAQPTGYLPPQFLLAPDEMISVEAVDSSDIVATGATRNLPSGDPPRTAVEISSDVLLVATIALVVLALPVVIFVSSATQLGLERRRSRVRVLSLSGASGRQIRVFVMIEAVTAAISGVIVGYGVFLVARPLVARLHVGGRTTFAASLRPPVLFIVAVFCFVLVTAVVTSLKITRQIEAEPIATDPSRWTGWAGFLTLGFGFVGLAVGAGSPSTTDAPHPLALVGMVLVAIGLALVGKTAVAIAGRRMATRTGNGVTMLAARRMDRSSAEINRPLAAVVTAVFVVSAFFTITGTLLKSSNPRLGGIAEDGVLIEAAQGNLPEIAREIEGQPGVRSVVVREVGDSSVTEDQIVVTFDAAESNLEDVRTLVVASTPTAQVRSVAEIEYDLSVSAREVRTLAAIGLVIVLALATFSLSVGTASHLLQRRDAFAFLRAGGVLPRQIGRLLALETTAPLAVSAAAGGLLGVISGAAVAFSAGTDPEVPWSTISIIYLSAVLLGVLVWAAFTPLLERLTAPTELRFE